MEKYTHKAETTPGRQTFRLTRDEVALAVFAFAMGREPTKPETKRLRINNSDYHTEPWGLTLSFENESEADNETP